jgi:hypothetical protein
MRHLNTHALVSVLQATRKPSKPRSRSASLTSATRAAREKGPHEPSVHPAPEGRSTLQRHHFMSCVHFEGQGPYTTPWRMCTSPTGAPHTHNHTESTHTHTASALHTALATKTTRFHDWPRAQRNARTLQPAALAFCAAWVCFKSSSKAQSHLNPHPFLSYAPRSASALIIN